MKNKILFLSTVFALTSYGATMDLNQVLREVKSNSYNIKTSERNLEIRELDEKRALKNLLPGANLSVDKEILNSDVIKDGKFGPQKIEMPINLYSGGRRVNSYKKIKLDSEIAREGVNSAYQKDEIKAIELYFNILNLQKQIEITKFTDSTLRKQENRLNILFSSNKMVS
ncbi:MAG: TolC family protein, partial [Fusobacteriaceae bacterium]